MIIDRIAYSLLETAEDLRSDNRCRSNLLSGKLGLVTVGARPKPFKRPESYVQSRQDSGRQPSPAFHMGAILSIGLVLSYYMLFTEPNSEWQ